MIARRDTLILPLEIPPPPPPSPLPFSREEEEDDAPFERRLLNRLTGIAERTAIDFRLGLR